MTTSRSSEASTMSHCTHWVAWNPRLTALGETPDTLRCCACGEVFADRQAAYDTPCPSSNPERPS